MAELIDVAASGILLFCSYMSYRRRSRVIAINNRMRERNGEYQRRLQNGDYTNLDDLIDKLDKKYNTVTLRANFRDGRE